MADDSTTNNGTTTSVDPVINQQNTENLQTYLQVLGSVTDQTTLYSEKINLAKNKLIELSNSSTATGAGAVDTISKMSKAAVGIGSVVGSVSRDFGQFFNNTSTGFENLTEKTVGYGAQSTVAFNVLTTGTAALSSIFSKLGSVGEALGGSLGAVSTIVKNIGEDYLEAAQSGQNLEQSFMALAQSSGDFNKLFQDGGTSLDRLDQRVTGFISHTYDLAKATGINAEELAKMQSKLMTIPGFMEAQVGAAGKAMDATKAFTKVLSGTGRDAESVYQDLNFTYETLGYGADKAEQALGYISKLSTAANDLHIRFADAHDAIQYMTTGLALFGDNSEAVIRTMGKFVPALQDVGMSPAQSLQFIKDMTTSIGQLDRGTQSFISSRTGGPGGLQGAFQIENLLKQGKVDEVIDKVQSAFKQQIGGNVVTLEQAANSPQAAAQYQRQLSLAQSGAFGNFLKDDATASKFFDAMSKGNFDQVKRDVGGTREQALALTTGRGETVQNRYNTILNQLGNDVQKMAALAVQTKFGTVRARIGTDNENLRPAIYKNSEESSRQSANFTGSNTIGLKPETAMVATALDGAKTVMRVVESFQNSAIPQITRADSEHSLFKTLPKQLQNTVKNEINQTNLPGQRASETARNAAGVTAKANTQATSDAGKSAFTTNGKVDIGGTLDINCPGCGDRVKGQIKDGVMKEVIDQRGRALYGIPNK